ncbi:MAG: N-formylglutamate amidohydrolase [Rhodospirillaceae bacterium]|nr:N-formylglutamate amidohydrolase [Rhodospirillaceae bacterium]MCA8931842.1 N-formylglutamate amidohydrolase [Rhodospirillaceae bacterium]
MMYQSPTGDDDAVIEATEAADPRVPVVVASPHSGRNYSALFLEASRLDPVALRRSEDSFVDEIFADAPGRGAAMIKALFPRAFLDTNREAFELDPEMFDDRLPGYVNTRSPRVIAGLGTIARVVSQGHEIYKRKLHFAEALERINSLYHPYHTSLLSLIRRTRQEFGYCILLDGHSMPSYVPGHGDLPGHPTLQDIVLGDAHGTACAQEVMAVVERFLSRRGYRVTRNTPYAGGYTTRHYGRPDAAVHAIQIEINRGLYMDEQTLTRKPFLDDLRNDMGDLINTLASLDGKYLRGTAVS